MSTNFIFRFEKSNLFIPFQMPSKRQRQAAVNQQTSPEDARRSSVIARIEKIKDQLQIPEYVEQNQPRVWLEESYDVGDLVFAVLDIPWKAFYEKAQNLLEQYKDYEMTVRTDLLTQVDWRHYQPPQSEKQSSEPSFKKWFPLNLFTHPAKKSSGQEPPTSTEGTSHRTPRTIAQGLAAPEQTAYCQVAQLYNDVKHSLADYPAMAALLAHYCTNAASDYYLQAIKTLDMTRLTDLDRSIMEQNGFLRVLHHEIYWCNALVQCSECVERYMKSFPTPDFLMKSYAGMDDRELCAASITILKMMAEQFRLLADFQPELASLVQYTLVEADLHPDKSADQRYGDALLVRHSGVAAGQKLYEQLRLRMLGRLSLPQEKASSRRHPDIASRSYFVADNLPAVAMAEFVQLCSQHETARKCQHCGMLFLSKNTGAKCCNRKSPNGGLRTCREVRKEERASEREVPPPVDVLNKVNKRMNGRLARSLGMTTERRASILKIWRKEVKPLVQEATDHQETFDEEAFDARLCEIFDRVRQEEAAAERRRQEEANKKRGRQKKR